MLQIGNFQSNCFFLFPPPSTTLKYFNKTKLRNFFSKLKTSFLKTIFQFFRKIMPENKKGVNKKPKPKKNDEVTLSSWTHVHQKLFSPSELFFLRKNFEWYIINKKNFSGKSKLKPTPHSIFSFHPSILPHPFPLSPSIHSTMTIHQTLKLLPKK